uniref:Uncharacterized protein n=1 Tax=Setaria digitata TaxID=48799 RepID=A0A915PQ30_9BILA
MRKTQITYDTEVPAPLNIDDKLEEQCGTYHNYSLPHGTIRNDNKRKLYDKPQMNDKHEMETVGSSTSHGTAINSIYYNQTDNNHQSTIRNYDIPKDTLNNDILQSGSHPVPPCSPAKQPLLHSHLHKHPGSQKGISRPLPPTIVLSPPDETSSEKVKVIFEYDKEKYTAQPNFLLRYKRIILTVAITFLIILLLIFIVLVVYSANRRRL